MAKKTKKSEAATNGNGNGREIATYVAQAYPELSKAAGNIVLQMENVKPSEARKVSGFVRTLIATAAKKRHSEAKDFRKEKRVAASAERLAKMKAKHEALVNS